MTPADRVDVDIARGGGQLFARGVDCPSINVVTVLLVELVESVECSLNGSHASLIAQTHFVDGIRAKAEGTYHRSERDSLPDQRH